MSEKLELKGLLEAGCHFGHQTHKWNPNISRTCMVKEMEFIY